MSAVETPKAAMRIGYIGLAILVFAFTYQWFGWQFLGQYMGSDPWLQSPSQTLSKPQEKVYQVTRVVDGDTLHINMNDTDVVVRLLGINTPETVDPRRPVQCFGKEASDRMKELAGGQLVHLEFDDTQSLHDAYGRLLAYVYLQDNEMLNRKMIAEGYAYEYTYMMPYKYRKEFRQLQSMARVAHRGLWSRETCNGSTKLTQ